MELGIGSGNGTVGILGAGEPMLDPTVPGTDGATIQDPMVPGDVSIGCALNAIGAWASCWGRSPIVSAELDVVMSNVNREFPELPEAPDPDISIINFTADNLFKAMDW